MLEEMRKMIAEQLNCEESEITADTSFKDDLGADSLDLFELVMALEDEYNIEIPAEELTELATVGDVIEYLKGRGIEAHRGHYRRKARRTPSARYRRGIQDLRYRRQRGRTFLCTHPRRPAPHRCGRI